MFPGAGGGGGEGGVSPSSPSPQVLHPSGLSWRLKCDVASTLLIRHILLPLVTMIIFKLLLQESWNCAAESWKEGELDGEGALLD